MSVTIGEVFWHAVHWEPQWSPAPCYSTLTLPPGADHRTIEGFNSLRDRIAEITESGELPATGIEPELLWFEDGFFVSSMAIDWQCAWVSRGISGVQTGDAEVTLEAVETLRGFTAATRLPSRTSPDWNIGFESAVNSRRCVQLLE